MQSEKTNRIKEHILFCLILIIIALPTILNFSCISEAIFLNIFCSLSVTLLLTCLVMLMPYRWLRWGVFTFLFVLSLFELAHELVYHGDIASAGYIRSLFMTTPYEAEGALGRVIEQHLIFIIVLEVAYIATSVLVFITQPKVKQYIVALIIALVLTLTMGIVTARQGVRTAIETMAFRPPLNIYMQIAEAYRQNRQRNHKTAKSIKADYNIRQSADKQCKQIYLLVIDESLSYERLSINKRYQRPTTPRIESNEQVVSFSNYYATGVFTMYAVPMLITPTTAFDFESNYSAPTIQEVFKQSGFNTYWITNEAQIVNDGVSGYIAKGAEQINVHCDIDMPWVVDSICSLHDRVFAVLHLWGSHQFYLNTMQATNRYFPDVTTRKKVRGTDIYNNSYDNTILYTDSLLAALIEVTERRKALSTILFTSDHGEGPITDTGGAHGYTHPHKSEYHVPLMVWYSDEYKEAHPEKVVNLIKHKDEPVCADHVFWSVLDMADIQIDNTLQQDGMSVFGDTLLPHRRTLLLPDGRSVLTLD